ncbi:MAG: hypothetical protein J5851_09160 [Oscillospiraceae bacterium]|nr:hypothetical protein [Oscillospiraceae bacterium]
MKKRLLGMLLVLVMVIFIVPDAVVAEDIGAGSPQTESYGQFVDGGQVISDMIDRNGMYAHPRIIMSEDRFDRLRRHIGDDSVTGILIEKLRKEADRVMTTSVCQYEIPDGIRLLETSKRIQRRIRILPTGKRRTSTRTMRWMCSIWG